MTFANSCLIFRILQHWASMDCSPQTKKDRILKRVTDIITISVMKVLGAIIDEYLCPLVYSSPASPLLPRLTQLDLNIGPAFNEETLLRLIESRWLPDALHTPGTEGVACLEYVGVDLSCPRWWQKTLDETSLDRIRVLRAAGLRIALR